MLSRMTAQQFYEWMAFYHIEREAMKNPVKPEPAAQTPADMLAVLGG